MKKIIPAVLLVCSLVSARATVFNYIAIMDGPSEFPANASPGTGFGTASYDDVTHFLVLTATFSGLTGTTTASHIHAPTAVALAGTASVATTTPSFALFPLGVSSGSYSNALNLTLASSYNPAFVTANGGSLAASEVALMGAVAAGKAYWNIHSSTFGGGEIRGFLVPVPEPGSLALLGLGGVALAVRRMKRAR